MRAKRSIIPVFVPHLGCPHTCVFCDQNRISGAESPATAQDVKNALRDALALLPKDTEKTLAFYGGSFTAIPAKKQEELLGAAAPWLQRGDIKDIRLSTRPDAVDEETVERLKRYGVRTVELGIQSMVPEVLKASQRGHSPEDARAAAALIKSAGFELILQMMTGLPGDSLERSLYTARELIKLSPDGVRVYPTVIIRGTELARMWEAGEYPAHTPQEAARWGAELLDLFEAAGIPVIRFGLNPTEDLSGGEAIGGAYHPALRDLAESVRYLKKERLLLSGEDRGETVRFAVGHGQVSAATGQRRANVEALRREFGVKDVKFIEKDLKPGEILKIACNNPPDNI